MALRTRFMLPDRSERVCTARHISVRGALLDCRETVLEGTAIVAYIEMLGRMECTVNSAGPDGLRVTFQIGEHMRERLAHRLRLAEANDALSDGDRRRHPRFTPNQRTSELRLPTGRSYPCKVMDISLSGAGIEVLVRPPIGTEVMLGRMSARVARHLPHGIAVEFCVPLQQEELKECLD